MYNFNHYNKQTLLLPLLFHQHSIIFTYIILTKPVNFCTTDTTTYCLFATRASQLKIWHFLSIVIERNVCRYTLNRYSVIMQFAKLAVGEQLCHRCTHRKLWHFKTFKSFSWKISHFELWHCCHKWAICTLIVTYFLAVHFKQILVSAPWGWWDNNTKIEDCVCWC